LAGGTVEFKANANGLVIVFGKSDSFGEIYGQIAKKLESSGYFFQTRYLATQYRGRKLSADEEAAITKMMSKKPGAGTNIFEFDQASARAGAQAAALPSEAGRRRGGPQRGAGAGAGGGMGGQGAAGQAGAAGMGPAGPAAAGRADAAAGGGRASRRRARDASGDAGGGFGRRGNPAAGDGGGFGYVPAGGDGGYGGAGRNGGAAAQAPPPRSVGWGPDPDECMTKYVRGTLRSGKFVSFDGNVVVIGDVNPGAEVEATGSIIVLGNLRGTVHAGASGNAGASVIALILRPTHLRIADLAAQWADAKGGLKISPEMASIKDGAIAVETLMAALK
jgi:septum formation inhibitor MinC